MSHPLAGNRHPTNQDAASRSHDSRVVDLSQVVPSEVDALLAKELNQLTVCERTSAIEEIHGVHNLEATVQENRINEALLQLQAEIDKIQFKPAYDEAVRLKSKYVFDRKFRLKFLWAERFNPEMAAIRMMKFLDIIAREAFGSQVLLRPILMEDLTPNARAVLREGSATVLPARDSSGRRVLAILGDIGAKYPPIDRLRMEQYMWQNLSDDEDSQKLGIILVLNLSNMVQNANDTEDKTNIGKLLQSIPGRYAAIHLCLPDAPLFNAIKGTFMLLMGKANRFRARIHVGSPTEIRYSLRSFGIPTECLPVNLENNCKQYLKSHLKWIDTLQAKDIARKNCSLEALSSIIDCPRRQDCLLGKGRLIMKHPGNIEMRQLLEAKLSKWESATIKEKAGVSWEVVREVKELGGRFLKEDPNGWYVEVADEAARQKVSIGFRDLVKRTRKRREMESTCKEQRQKSIPDDVTTGLENNSETQPPLQTLLESDTFDFVGVSAGSFPTKRRKLGETCKFFSSFPWNNR
mmetsp:Transcript_13286/g.23902  ORF Transcript_13286/g.23902 Transcript_13286/m.23902 type:complete len:521 (+) Transcript_13286:142-1704(+)|eukprot:CAMPEP_0178740112 /NCGR_PEP_ID=MMETSP0744-20121128/4412_1 /TAXON_ID=913974 /ORGANISM="Nitzschia punctata, Strain CCMP561" /LENGTH=520 /DNA_ID=CAMNT_0020392855 /DNA_START=8 /DNA_END=1570 /DNA_ORIENTATION=-